MKKISAICDLCGKEQSHREVNCNAPTPEFYLFPVFRMNGEQCAEVCFSCLSLLKDKHDHIDKSFPARSESAEKSCTATEHLPEQFYNKFGTMIATVCSCGFATTASVVCRHPDNGALQHFAKMHARHLSLQTKQNDLEAAAKKLITALHADVRGGMATSIGVQEGRIDVSEALLAIRREKA